MSKEEWIAATHAESVIECHTKDGHQCAGAATYRANVSKTPRYPEILILPKDKTAVFAMPQEFLDYHEDSATTVP